MRNIYIIAILIIGINIITPPAAHSQITEIGETVTTSVAIQQLFAELTNMINKARDDGDYLLAKAGVEAMNALDAWQHANTSLLDKAFKELDKTSRETFARINQLVYTANTDAEHRLETVQQITENASLILENIPTAGNQTFVLRYSPRVEPPQKSEKFTLRVRGVNLDKGNPVLKLKNTSADRSLIGPLEVQYTIPSAELPHDLKKMEVAKLELSYSTPSESWILRLLGVRNNVTRELPVVVLPEELGTIEGTAIRHFERRVEKPFTRDLGQFKAKNSRVYKIATPEDGWKWDLSKPLTKHQYAGEAGRCEGVDLNNSSGNGISFFAHLDKIQNWKYPAGAPGYVNCSLEGTLYKMESVDEAVALPIETIYWTEDKHIDLPDNTETLRLRIKTFDMRTREFNGTGSDQFFDLRREPTAIVIVPKAQQDI